MEGRIFMKKLTITGILIIFALAFTGCTSKKEDNTMKDGCYTAQMQEYSYGWKESVSSAGSGSGGTSPSGSSYL